MDFSSISSISVIDTELDICDTFIVKIFNGTRESIECEENNVPSLNSNQAGPSSLQTVSHCINDNEAGPSLVPGRKFCANGQRVCAANCPKNKSKKLHTFPAIFSYGQDRVENLIRCRQYVKISGNHHLLSVSPRDLNRKYFLCSDHFTTDQYTSERREKLLHTAVPSICTNQPLSDDDLKHFPLTLQKLNQSIPIMTPIETQKYTDGNSEVVNISAEDILITNDDSFNASLMNNSSFNASQTCGITSTNFLQAVTPPTMNPAITSKFCTSGKRVCAANCLQNKSKKLHTFPAIFSYGQDRAENLVRCRQYVKISGNHHLLSVSPRDLNGKYFLCSDHFTSDQYTSERREKLLHTAVPSICTNQPLSDEDLKHFPLTLQRLNQSLQPSFSNDETQPISSGTENEAQHGTGINTEQRNDHVLSEEVEQNNSPEVDQNNNSLNPDNYQKKFEEIMNSFEWRTCNTCKERFFTRKENKKKCCHSRPYCEARGEDNNMDPGEVPEELSGLTYIEEQLISRIHPIVSVYKIKGNQYSYSGNVINFPQDVQELAMKLPHNINDLTSMITVRTSKDNVDYKDFQVRGAVVRRALIWLKRNNPYYFDVQICNDNLSLLPDDANVYGRIPGFDSVPSENNIDDPEENSEENVKGVTETGIPQFRPPAPEEQIENVIGWPRVGDKPVDEFKTIGYIVQCFPCLFPYGRADLRQPREVKVSDISYFQHMMNYHDQRFSKHARFRFFALNSLMRWLSLNDGNIFVKRFPEFKNMSVEELRQKIEEDPNLLKKIMFQGNNIRGSKAYWHARGKELQTMVEQIGLPTIFLTLSAADLHWPELFKILVPDEDLSNMTEHRRRQLIQENPMIVDQFFLERVDTFLSEVLQKKYEVKDFWFRIEYQHRGSPHFHGVVWLNNAPDVTNIESASEEELLHIIEFFDQLVSTMHPNPNEPPAPVHPSRMRLSEVVNYEQDMAQLLNRVQIHSKCSESYCLRKDKNNPRRKKCRFNFPVPMCDSTTIQQIDKDVHLITKKNHCYLNKFNPYIMQSWRANMDFSPVLSRRALIIYLTKYISKSETKSEDLVEMLRGLINETANEKSAKHAIQRLFIKMCSERDFSAQETCHILMGTKLYSAGGRRFVTLNFNENSTWMQVHNKNTPRKSLLEKYKERQNLENETLWNFAKKYNVKRQDKENIVMVYPTIAMKQNADNENYYRQQCMLYLPWKIDDASLLKDDMCWKNLYDERLSEIIANKGNSSTIQVESNECNEENDGNYVEDPLNLEDWMTLSRMRPNQLTQSSDLGLREIDLNFDWHASYAKYEHLGGIPYLQSFIKKCKQDHRVQEDIEPFPDVEFSPEQQEVIQLARLQIENLNNISQLSIPKRVMVQGKAGTGKSLVISAIVSIVVAQFGIGSVLLLGPTGVSAVNINGATIHSKLRINPKAPEFLPLRGAALHEFRRDMEKVKLVIIDEYSMVGCAMLHKIDERLRQATSNPTEEFGGLCVYLFGDVKQLAPIGDAAAYSTIQKSFEALKGKQIYDSIQASVILKKIHRQQDEKFLQILDHISTGKITKEDYNILKTRFTTSVSPEERLKFHNAMHLYPTKLKVNNFNKAKLEAIKNTDSGSRIPVARIPAKHNSKLASEGTENEAGLLPTLHLAIQASVMLRANLWTEQGLVNGSMGKVIDIVYDPDATPGYDAPAVLICQFDSYKGPYLNDELKTVPPNFELMGQV